MEAKATGSLSSTIAIAKMPVLFWHPWLVRAACGLILAVGPARVSVLVEFGIAELSRLLPALFLAALGLLLLTLSTTRSLYTASNLTSSPGNTWVCPDWDPFGTVRSVEERRDP